MAITRKKYLRLNFDVNSEESEQLLSGSQHMGLKYSDSERVLSDCSYSTTALADSRVTLQPRGRSDWNVRENLRHKIRGGLPILLFAMITILILLRSTCVHAGQVMDEVWYPSGTISWVATQFTPAIKDGVDEAIDYFQDRTPLELTEVASVNQGGLAKPHQLGVLEIRYSEGIFNYSWWGQTKHYRKPNKGNKTVKLSFENIKNKNNSRDTLAHEMGHVLGFTHEFQRWDREENGVSVGSVLSHPDWFYNFEKPDKKDIRVLSPYDHNSRFALGYPHVTPTPKVPESGNLLSKHDINSIYRVYGRSLGRMDAGIRFGEAAASGDFDGDDIDDLAIAAQYSETGASSGSIYFFKGVAQAPGESGTGTTYVPWFREDVYFSADQNRKIVLTTGDTHMLSAPKTVSATSDGISELIVGLPGAGRVEIWVVNSAGRFEDGLGTFGGHGIGYKIVIRASDVGITGGSPFHGFGSSLACGHFFNSKTKGDDLAIGAPEGGNRAPDDLSGHESFDQIDKRKQFFGIDKRKPLNKQIGRKPLDKQVARKMKQPVTNLTTSTVKSSTGKSSNVKFEMNDYRFGPSAVYLLHDADPKLAVKIIDSMSEPDSDFGNSLAVMKNFDKGYDTLVVGAPGKGSRGEIFVYKRADFDKSGNAVAPALLDSFSGSTTESRFGTSLATFTTREEGSSTEHWIAVGAPKANVSGTKCGSVELYNFKYSGQRSAHRLNPGSRQEGMRFGQSIAAYNGKCTSQLCPKERVWLAIGSPQAKVDGNTTGKVFLWNVWADGQLTSSTEGAWNGNNQDGRYGQKMIGVRSTEEGGGFLVLGKRSHMSVLNGTSVSMVETGLAQLRFNEKGTSTWKSWIRNLGPNTTGDMRPKNR